MCAKMDGIMPEHRLVLPHFLSREECKVCHLHGSVVGLGAALEKRYDYRRSPAQLLRQLQLEFIHKSCGVVGYRPWVLSTTLCHLVATNCANLILPLLPIRERVKELVEEYFGREYELFTEFTGLISWTKGAKIGWHSDDNRPYLRQRHYSAVCYLNSYGEDFEGGLFHFEDGNIRTIVPTAGTVVIYTADERNMHSVDEITDGERCTLALWFTLDKAHDEDEKVIQQLASLNLDFSHEKSDQNLEQGRVLLQLPVSASSIMYNVNANLQQGEDPAEERPPDELPITDLRVDRMARLGFSHCSTSVETGTEQEQPVEVFLRDKKLPGTFCNLMHALQVVEFHHYRRSMMKQDSSSGGEKSPKHSKMNVDAPVQNSTKESSGTGDIFGDMESERDLGYHSDDRFSPGSSCKSIKKTGTEDWTKETEVLQIDAFVDSWREWNAYTSMLWAEVYEFLPMWKASRLLASHNSGLDYASVEDHADRAKFVPQTYRGNAEWQACNEFRASIWDPICWPEDGIP